MRRKSSGTLAYTWESSSYHRKNMTLFIFFVAIFGLNYVRKVGPDLNEHLNEFEKAFKATGLSETPKIHAILRHITDCLEYLDGYGLGVWSEQAGESIHRNGLSSSVQTLSRVQRFSGIHIATKTHPTVVRVTYFSKPICDGSLISNRLSLTAAHCIFRIWHDRTSLLINSKGSLSIHKVSNIDYHKDYHPSSSKNDVALIKLAAPITDSQINIQPVKFLQPGHSWSREWRVISYRYTTYKNSEEGALIEVTSNPLISAKLCGEFYNLTAESMEGFFCAASKQFDHFSKEMTGGPAIFDDTPYQVGIILHVGTYHGVPLIYTNISTFYDWIKEKELQLSLPVPPSTALYPLPETELNLFARDRGEPAVNGTKISTVAITNVTNGKLMCMGSLVAPDIVLTTARCVRKGYERLRVHSILRNLGESAKITKFYVHPEFNPKSPEHDVALLKFEPTPRFSGAVHEVEIDDSILAPQSSGYLYSFVGGSDLRRKELLVIDLEECSWLYEKTNGVPEGTVCAKSPRGMCNHVAGEPLIVQDKLTGILTAVSKDCADPRIPGIYIRMDKNYDWINQKISYLAEREEGL